MTIDETLSRRQEPSGGYRALGNLRISATMCLVSIVRDIEHLKLEMETLWGEDVYGRPLRRRPRIALATAADGWAVFGSDEPWQELARGRTPEALILDLQEERKIQGSTRIQSGPSYVVDQTTLAVPTPSEDQRIVVVDEGKSLGQDATPPEPGWTPDEWADLVAGRIGPVAFGFAGDRIDAICFTPVASPNAAEAGVWTHPEARRRGWASLVTAAWAEVAQHRFETLFYSTGSDNIASQSVARKLNLRPIGTIWQLWENGS